MKKALSLLLALAMSLGMLGASALAEDVPPQEESAVQAPSVWAYDALADAYAMGMLDDNYTSYIQSPVTADQLGKLTGVVADKLALLELPENELAPYELVIDTTRGGVMNALYQEAAAYSLPGIDADLAMYLTQLGVVKGDQNGSLHTDRVCTFQEAMVMAERLVLAVYDLCDAGSRGLLWKATNGDNTLYLLGTIHVDRNNVYPFHKSLRDAVAASQEVIFEVDFSDAEDMAAYQAMMVYSDGTGLKDHVSPELYADTVAVCAQLGMTEEQVNAYKPWVLLLTLNNLLSQDSTTSSNAMAIDLYLTSSASNAGKTVGAVETAVFQGAIFDGLSDEYQTEGLAAYVAMMKSALSGEAAETEDDQAVQDALAQQDAVMGAMMEAWKNRDVDAFNAVFDKAATLESSDEMNSKLFTERDPHMIEAAAGYLEREGENTFFLAVGAGHMVDPGGIVGGLRDLGYTVELVK